MKASPSIGAAAAAVLALSADAPADMPWLVLPCWGGGYVQNAAFCPGNPLRMYLYVDVGGPYRSDDAGANWRPLHANMPVAMRERGFDQVRSLSVDPRDADSVVILAGRDGDNPGGFAVTRDGGRTWHIYNPLRGYNCGGIAFDRHVPGSVAFACPDGIYVSTNGGARISLLTDGLKLPSGTSRSIALDRGRLFFLTSGSGVYGTLLTPPRAAAGLSPQDLNFGIVPALLKTDGRLVTAISARQGTAADGGDLVVVECEGRDYANRVVVVAGLAAGAPVSLSLTASDGATEASLTTVADAAGSATFDIPVAPGSNYAYAVVQGGATLASGPLLAGRWAADGAWFRAEPDGHGGSVEIGGAWTSAPVITNTTSYLSGITSEFTLDAQTRAAGDGRFVRAEAAITYVGMRSVASLADLPHDGSLASVTVVETGSSGATAWAACVGGEWRLMHGAAPPRADVGYRLRMEGDFTLENPRVRLSVSADDGRTYETLLAPDGAEWLVPNDASRRALSSLAADGGAEFGGFRGSLADTAVAEVADVGYPSLAAALVAAGPGGTVTLLTDASAPLSLARGRTIVENGYDLELFDDTVATLIMLK